MDSERRRIEELAKHCQSQESQVQPWGPFGILNDRVVSKSGTEVWHNGDRISVQHGMVFKNGTYVGPEPQS